MYGIYTYIYPGLKSALQNTLAVTGQFSTCVSNHCLVHPSNGESTQMVHIKQLKNTVCNDVH